MISIAQERRIIKLVRRGKTIADISEDMGLSYGDVSNYLDSVDRTSWLGAKRIVSFCLRDLVDESDPVKRKELAERADYWADMLYYDAKRVGDMVDQALKTIENARDSLNR